MAGWSEPDAEGWATWVHPRAKYTEYRKRMNPVGTYVPYRVRNYALITTHEDGSVYGTSHHGYTRRFTTVEEAKRLLGTNPGTEV